MPDAMSRNARAQGFVNESTSMDAMNAGVGLRVGVRMRILFDSFVEYDGIRIRIVCCRSAGLSYKLDDGLLRVVICVQQLSYTR